MARRRWNETYACTLAGDAGARGRPAVQRDQQHAVPRRRSQGEETGCVLAYTGPSCPVHSPVSSLGGFSVPMHSAHRNLLPSRGSKHRLHVLHRRNLTRSTSHMQLGCGREWHFPNCLLVRDSVYPISAPHPLNTSHLQPCQETARLIPSANGGFRQAKRDVVVSLRVQVHQQNCGRREVVCKPPSILGAP